MTKKRAFDETEAEDAAAQDQTPAPVPSEPAPLARVSVALVLTSWTLPLGTWVSVLRYAEEEPGTLAFHRVLTIGSLLLLAAGAALATRAILRARRDPRIRRRLAVAAIVLSLLTPVVWASEVLFALEMLAQRDLLDAAAEGDAPAAPAE